MNHQLHSHQTLISKRPKKSLSGAVVVEETVGSKLNLTKMCFIQMKQHMLTLELTILIVNLTLQQSNLK